MLAALEALRRDLAVRTYFMPNWIGDQMAGVGPEATPIFGRNARIVLKNPSADERG